MKEKEEEKYRPISNRFKGLLKVAVGAAYWAATISSGAGLPVLTFLAGGATAMVGLGMRSIGSSAGWKKMEMFGADMMDFGSKVALAPVWTACYALDGVGNIITGSSKNKLSGWESSSKTVEQKYALQEKEKEKNRGEHAKQPQLRPERQSVGQETVPSLETSQYRSFKEVAGRSYTPNYTPNGGRNSQYNGRGFDL